MSKLISFQLLVKHIGKKKKLEYKIHVFTNYLHCNLKTLNRLSIGSYALVPTIFPLFKTIFEMDASSFSFFLGIFNGNMELRSGE